MLLAVIKENRPFSIHVVWGILLVALVAGWPYLPSFNCPFHQITGIPCLSCGASRAADSFFTGNFGAMFYYNPLLVVSSAALLLFSLLKLFEYILNIKIVLKLSRKAALSGKILIGLAVAANWLFLIVSNR
jgi:hypothetical protein